MPGQIARKKCWAQAERRASSFSTSSRRSDRAGAARRPPRSARSFWRFAPGARSRRSASTRMTANCNSPSGAACRSTTRRSVPVARRFWWKTCRLVRRSMAVWKSAIRFADQHRRFFAPEPMIGGRTSTSACAYDAAGQARASTRREADPLRRWPAAVPLFRALRRLVAPSAGRLRHRGREGRPRVDARQDQAVAGNDGRGFVGALIGRRSRGDVDPGVCHEWVRRLISPCALRLQ